MQTLIVYDNTGKIIMTQSGSIDIPESVAMTVADVPEGKMVMGVNLAGMPILEDIPKTPEQQRIEALEAANADIMLAMAEIYEGGAK